MIPGAETRTVPPRRRVGARQNNVVVGCNDGTVMMYQVVFSTVHGLYQDSGMLESTAIKHRIKIGSNWKLPSHRTHG